MQESEHVQVDAELERVGDAFRQERIEGVYALKHDYAAGRQHSRVRGVDASLPTAHEATRLADVLASVSEAPSDGVPGNSILRETIGGSSLEY